MFRLSFEFTIGTDRGKQATVVQKPIQDLSEVKRGLRTQRFSELEEQIRGSVINRVTQHNTQPNAALYLATEEQATKTGSKLFVTATTNAHRELVVAFKPDAAEVRIKSQAWDYTICVVVIEPASTGLQRKQSGSRSWSVLDDASSVERMLDQAFVATFRA